MTSAFAEVFCVGIYLSYRAASSQVLSARVSLTAVFGMGTGVPSPSSAPTMEFFQEPSELNKVTLKSVWKEPAAGCGHHTASCQNVFVYICSNIVGQALDLLVLSS